MTPAVRVEDLEHGDAAVGGQADHVTLHQQGGLGQREVSFVRQSTGRRVEAADDAGRGQGDDRVAGDADRRGPSAESGRPEAPHRPGGQGKLGRLLDNRRPGRGLGLASRRVCGRAERREAPDDQTAREDGEVAKGRHALAEQAGYERCPPGPASTGHGDSDGRLLEGERNRRRRGQEGQGGHWQAAAEEPATKSLSAPFESPLHRPDRQPELGSRVFERLPLENAQDQRRPLSGR